MSFLTALGGIGSGVSAGIQDLRQMDEDKFRKEQQARQRQEWQAEDEDTKTLAGLDPKLQGAELYKAKGEALSRSKSRTNQKLGAEYLEMGRKMTRDDITDRAQRVGEVAKNAAYLHSIGNHEGAMRLLQGGYEMFPDGRKIVMENGTWGVANPSGKWEVAPQPINAESTKAAVDMAMKFSNPSLWSAFRKDDREGQELGIKNRHLDITAGHYKDIGEYYRGKNAIDQQQLNAQIAAGYFNKDHPFTPIGLSDDGTRILGRQGSGLKEAPVPAGYSGLFPKVTGAKDGKVAPAKWEREQDGTFTAHAADGKPLFNIIEGGVEAPLGINNSRWMDIQKQAKGAGVRAHIGKNDEGVPTLAYEGRDGQYYSSLDEAKAAKPKKK